MVFYILHSEIVYLFILLITEYQTVQAVVIKCVCECLCVFVSGVCVDRDSEDQSEVSGGVCACALVWSVRVAAGAGGLSLPAALPVALCLR